MIGCASLRFYRLSQVNDVDLCIDRAVVAREDELNDMRS